MKNRQSVLQNIKWLAGANIIVKPVWFFFLLLIARLLGPEEFGKYMFAISYVSIIAVLLEGGVDIHSVRVLSSGAIQFPTFFAHTSLLKLIISFLVGCFAIASTFLVDITTTSRMLVFLAVLYSLFYTLMTHCRFIFRAFEVMKLEAQSIMIEKIMVISLCGLALVIRSDAEMFLVFYAFSYMISCILTIYILLKNIGFPDWNITWSYLWIQVLKPAIPFALMSFFMIIYFRSATIMIGALTEREDLIGFYNAGYRLVEAFILFPSIIIGPMYPVFSRQKDDKVFIGNMVIEATRYITLISILIALPLYMFKEEFTLLFYGPGYSDASSAVGFLGMAMIPVGVTWVFGSLVAAIGRQSKANVFIFGVTVLNIGLHYVLIPLLGLNGAVLTTLLTEYTIAIINVWIVQDYLNVRKFSSLIAKAVIPAVVVYLIKTTGILPGPFLIQVAIAIIVLLIGYFIMKFMTLTDLRRLVVTK